MRASLYPHTQLTQTPYYMIHTYIVSKAANKSGGAVLGIYEQLVIL